MSKAKSFMIERQLVLDAYLKVNTNNGSGGIDEMSSEEFDEDYRNYLCKILSQMSSGSYIPPPVKLVNSEKKDRGKFRNPGAPPSLIKLPRE